MSIPVSTKEKLPLLLLVEDSETSAALIVRYLRGHYEVRHAHDGQEAWDMLLADKSVELILTDIQMPRMTGHELLTKIRTSDVPELKYIPIIVMTTTDDNMDRNLAFENGANDFVRKPVDSVELQARVHVHQKLSHTIRELDTNRKLLQEQATTDALTQLKNRRAFFDIGLRHLALARRHGNDLSLIMLDVDRFKHINDTHGHQVGDEALISVAEALRTSTRAEDVPTRIGGEEFAILLPDTSPLGAMVLAERIRTAIEEKKITVADLTLSLTVSLRVVSYSVDRRETIEELLNVADKRLYTAKQGGRNRIVNNDDGKVL